MLKAPPCVTAIDGFTVTVVEHPNNLASGANDQGAHLLEDGYLQLHISNDGSNLFWPNAFTDSLLVVRLQATNEVPQVVSEYDICILGADDSPVKIILNERAVGETYGVWLMIACESPLIPEPNEFAGYPFLVEEAHYAG